MNLITHHTLNSFLTPLLSIVQSTIEKKPTQSISIALSGGNTPIAFYQALANSTIPLSTTMLYQVDERYVPATQPESNHKLIKENLLCTRNNELISWNYFDTSLPIKHCLQEYEKKLTHKSNGFDLCFLGIGNDGHTASLFPHSPAVLEHKRSVAHTKTDMFAIHDRLTITFPEIMASKKLLILLKGKEKQTIINTVLHSSQSIEEIPAKKLLFHPNAEIHHLCI